MKNSIFLSIILGFIAVTSGHPTMDIQAKAIEARNAEPNPEPWVCHNCDEE
jgi:hypothetical protein